jgi:type 1 glutamine amidotransferase
MHLKSLLSALVAAVVLAASHDTGLAAQKHLLMLAGSPSHGYLEHEYRAGCLLLQSCLANTPELKITVVSNNWPADESVFRGVDAVFMFCTGGAAHPANHPGRLKTLEALMEKGVGFGTCHYGVEVPDNAAGTAFLKWQGGYFATNWSVNPHWTASFEKFPSHPVTRGVKPFKINDEWYYHMRFVDDMKGVTPILSAVPPDKSRGRPGINDPHGGNPHVQARMGQAEHVMWCYERPGGGRGFGFTGAHFHKNWEDENYRKVMLNALLWLSQLDVPTGGVASQLSAGQILENLDPKKKKE